jgi:tRNA/rRNA methyltransferase
VDERTFSINFVKSLCVSQFLNASLYVSICVPHSSLCPLFSIRFIILPTLFTINSIQNSSIMLPLLPRFLSILLSSTTGGSSLQNIGLRSISNISTKFILIDTKHPGNVGAAARGMKTMGFSDLILVTPTDDRVLGRKKCADGASGAVDVLKEARIFDSLDDVFEGDDDIIVCGTGMPFDMRLERMPQRYVSPRKFFDELLQGGAATCTRNEEKNEEKEKNIRIAFVFGNERYGMKAEDMRKCDVILGIPTNPKFGSLNLATAVQIIAYDWREAMGGFTSETGCEPHHS